MGEDGDGCGVVGNDRLVIVVHKLAGVKLVTTVQDGVGDKSGVSELGRQTTDLRSNHDHLWAKVPLEEGPGLVPNADDPDIAEVIPLGHLLVQLGPDVLANTAVNGSCKSSVGGHGNIQFLRGFLV